MEDVLTETPPPSRFFDEDLDNFAAPLPPLPPPFLILSPTAAASPSLLIIAISAPSLALLHRLPHKSLAGTLILPEIPLSSTPLLPSPRHPSLHLYSTPSGPLLAAVHLPVSPARARSVARCLLDSVNPSAVLVLDSIRPSSFRGRLSADEPLAFKLETAEQLRRKGPVVARGVEYMPSGSVMDGLGAAVMGECQMRRGKGTLIATWPEGGRPSAVPFLRTVMRDAGVEVGEGGVDGEEGDRFRVCSGYGSELYT